MGEQHRGRHSDQASAHNEDFYFNHLWQDIAGATKLARPQVWQLDGFCLRSATIQADVEFLDVR